MDDKVNLLIILQWFDNFKLDFSAVIVSGQEIWLFGNHWQIVAFYLHCLWVFFSFKYGIKCFFVLQLWCRHWWLYRQITSQSHSPFIKVSESDRILQLLYAGNTTTTKPCGSYKTCCGDHFRQWSLCLWLCLFCVWVNEKLYRTYSSLFSSIYITIYFQW